MERDTITTKVTEFINGKFIFDQSIQLTREQKLIDSGIIDSIGVLELIDFIEATYSINIDDEELVPANLGTIDAVARFIVKKMNGH